MKMFRSLLALLVLLGGPALAQDTGTAAALMTLASAERALATAEGGEPAAADAGAGSVQAAAAPANRGAVLASLTETGPEPSFRLDPASGSIDLTPSWSQAALQETPLLPVDAQEQSSETASSDRPWTRIGLYGFLPAIDGNVGFRRVDADVDVSMSDLLDNLDAGFMAFVEHRRGPWSFIVDLAYLDVSKAGGTSVTGPVGLIPVTVTAEIEFEQTLLEGFVGYRVLEHGLEDGRIGVDVLAGARYNRIDLKLGSSVSVLGLSTARDRERDEEWVDGVFGIRGEYRANAAWSLTGWADYGIGADSDSYQLQAYVHYRFDNGVILSGGYRYYHMHYDKGSGSSRVEFDLDYSGPAVGLTFTF